MRDLQAWKTENWIRLGSDVFMVQQKWKLHREKDVQGRHERSYAAMSQTAFPTNDWRIVSLYEVLDEDDVTKLLEARDD